ncbi:putative organic cation transporter protein-like [Apostichopus japonicus]|uniref:Putative organic cation transporter protein-like n=1 Tax=Stichopus japonicus TaxID=307972 RepID=A0A2G8JC27_STIJA|nr:putative organic cation transporter protein-like [Apostichopus japonicus]
MMDQLKKDEEAESEQRKRVEKPYIQDLFKSKDLRFKIPNIVFNCSGQLENSCCSIRKFCISASFAIIYFYTAEILPTSVRTVGIALCTTASNLTVALASLILLLSAIWEELPYLIFGTFTIVGGLLVLLLPETRGCPLPEHLTTADPVRKPEKEFSPLVSSTEV